MTIFVIGKQYVQFGAIKYFVKCRNMTWEK